MRAALGECEGEGELEGGVQETQEEDKMWIIKEMLSVCRRTCWVRI